MRFKESIHKGRCYIIAEIGANHCGSFETAKQMVEVAAACGADAVKLQKRDVYGVYPAQWNEPYHSENRYGETYIEHRRALELSLDQHNELSAIAYGLGLDYGLSCWDRASAEAVVAADCCDWLKVASATLTDHEVLEVYSRSETPVIVSTGMSTAPEIGRAMAWLSDCDVAVLVCTSAYPCAAEDVNLARLGTLKALYPFATVGVSGHWKGIAIDVGAVAMGARILERHFTLDRSWKGTDHAASLEPAGLDKLVRDVRAFESAVGSPEIRVLPCEESSRAKLRVKP